MGVVKMKSRLGLIAAAVILSLLATLAIALYLRQEKAQIESEGELVSVLIADKPIPAGMSISAISDRKLASAKEIPRKYLAEGAIDSLEKVKDRVLTVPVNRGEQLTEEKFKQPEQASLNLRIPAGRVAISIPVDEVIGVAEKISPGDRVSVLGTMGAKSGDISTTKLFLQNIEVLAVSSMDGSGSSRKAGLTQTSSLMKKTVTLAVTPAEAEKLVLVEEEGHVWLVLLPPAAQPVSTPGQTRETVFK